MNKFILLYTRFALPLWRASPHHTPRGPGTLPSPLVKDTALILTRRAGQVCSACHSIGFRAVSRFTAVVRESPLPLGLLFLDAHDNSRMFLLVAGMPLDDFCRLTPKEFGAVCKAWNERQEQLMRDGWERMRMNATIGIQPHVKGRVTPERLLAARAESSLLGLCRVAREVAIRQLLRPAHYK